MKKRNPPIHIHFNIGDTHSKAAGISIFIYIEAHRRNNYPVGYFITDNEGIVTPNWKQLRSLVNSAISVSPMEYAPDWEECDFLIIQVPNSKELNKRLKALRKNYPESAAELQKIMQQASNKNISMGQTFKIKMGAPAELDINIS